MTFSDIQGHALSKNDSHVITPALPLLLILRGMHTNNPKSSSKNTPVVSDSDALPETETAPILGVTVRCLQNWRALKWGPPYYKVGRLVRYKRSDIDAFLARQFVSTEESRDVGVARRKQDRQTAA